jgi:hypothetical protein
MRYNSSESMDKEKKARPDLIKKMKNIARSKTTSGDVVLDTARENYRSLVLTAHANVEHLMGLLIHTYFSPNTRSNETEDYIDLILEEIDYGGKIRILENLKFNEDKLNKKALLKARELANYRNAVAHLKKHDERRLATNENITKVNHLGDSIEDRLLLVLSVKDEQLFLSMALVVWKDLNESQQKKYIEHGRAALKERVRQLEG